MMRKRTALGKCAASRNRRKFVMGAALAPLATLSLVRCASAASYTFDSSGTGGATPVDGSGIWDTSSTYWSTAGVDTIWTNSSSNAAVFGSGNGSAAYTVTLQTAITVGTITFNSAGTGSYTLTGGSITGTSSSTPINIYANVNASIASPFTDSFSSINVNGAAVLSLTGASTFAVGIMNIEPGATVSVPAINAANVAGPLGESSGGVRDYGGTVITNGTSGSSHATNIKFYDEGGTIDNESTNGTVYLNGTTNSTGSQPANTLVTSRTITLTGNSAYAATFAGNIVDTTPTGPTTHTDVTSLLKSGTGEWILGSSSASTYTGTTTVANGTLGIALANSLPAAATITFGTAGTNNTAALDLGPTAASESLTVAGLASLGTDLTKDIITNNDTHANNVATLTINPDGAASPADSTFGGIIKNGATSKVALTKAGSHTLTLTGASTYTGATTVTGGTLSISGSIASTAIAVNANTGTANPTLNLMSVSALSSSSTIAVTTGSFTPTIYLDYNGNQTVNSLVIGGLAASAGVYSASSEPTGDPTLFASDNTYAGTLTVTTPEPGCMAMVAAGAAMLLGRRRRRGFSAASADATSELCRC